MNLKFGSFGSSCTSREKNVYPFYPSPRFQNPLDMPKEMITANQKEGCSRWSSKVEPEKGSMNKSVNISGTRVRTSGPNQNLYQLFPSPRFQNPLHMPNGLITANQNVGCSRWLSKVESKKESMNMSAIISGPRVKTGGPSQNLYPLYPSARFQNPLHMPNGMITANQKEGCSRWSSKVEPGKGSMNKSGIISGTRGRTGGPNQNM